MKGRALAEASKSSFKSPVIQLTIEKNRTQYLFNYTTIRIYYQYTLKISCTYIVQINITVWHLMLPICWAQSPKSIIERKKKNDHTSIWHFLNTQWPKLSKLKTLRLRSGIFESTKPRNRPGIIEKIKDKLLTPRFGKVRMPHGGLIYFRRAC